MQHHLPRAWIPSSSPSMAAKSHVDVLRGGRTIIDFTIGEPDFPTPPHIVAAGGGIELGGPGHTGSAGIPSLRRSLRSSPTRTGWRTRPSRSWSARAPGTIYNALAATLNEADEVIVPAPYWVSYPDMVALTDLRSSPRAHGFKLMPQVPSAPSRPNALADPEFPNNPTGAVYSAAGFEALGEVLLRHLHVWVTTTRSTSTCRQRYEARAWYRQHSSTSSSTTQRFVATPTAQSLRHPQALIKAVTLLLSQSTSCAAAMSQVAAVTALEGPQQCVADARSMFEQRRDRMVALLNQVRGIRCTAPDGAFYVFASVAGLIGATTPAGRKLSSDVEVATYFTDVAGVATIDGVHGLPSHLRLSFATAMDQIEPAAMLARAVEASTFPMSTRNPPMRKHP